MYQKVLVWDLPTRLFHWTLVVSFFGAYFTADSEYRYYHVMFGYTVLGLICFRLVWGWIGPRYARFGQFVAGPTAVVRHVRDLVRGHPEHHLGHNPAGALAVVLLLLLGFVSGVSGRLCYVEAWREPMELVHEWSSDIMLAVVAAHVLGVAVMSRLAHENLVWAMFTGRKLGVADQTIGSARPFPAVLLLCAIVGFWLLALPGDPFG